MIRQFKMADGRHLENSFFSHISANCCPWIFCSGALNLQVIDFGSKGVEFASNGI